MSHKVNYDIYRDGRDKRTRPITKGLPYVNNSRGWLIHSVRSAATHRVHRYPHMSVQTHCGASFAGSPVKLHLTKNPNDGGKFFCKRCYDAQNYQVSALIGKLKVQEVER